MRSTPSILAALFLLLSSFSGSLQFTSPIFEFPPHATAAVAQGAQVFEYTGNLKQDVLDWIEYLPRDQNRYRIPTQSNLGTWRQIINAIQGGDLTTAANLVQTIAPSYKVIKFTDTSSGSPRLYYLLLEANVTANDIFPFADTGWGAYIFDPQPIRDLAICIPHPKADAYTETEGIEALMSLRARWLLLSTSHRCASNTISPCTQGSSPFCSGGNRASDGSHGANPSAATVTNTFQVVHEELAKLSSTTLVIQFHGNAPCSSNFVLSNGGSNYQIVPNGNVYRLKQSLATVSSNIQLCDHPPGAGECDLCGTTNLQARYINGSTTNPCQTPALTPTTIERFIHIEQSLSMRQDSVMRQRIIQAIANTTFVRPSDTEFVCTDGWRITGYYTPLESEFSGALRSVFIEGEGTFSFISAFLDEVSIEGWGKTKLGWYIGFYGGAWHKNDAPLDANGNPLVIGTAATDRAVITSGSQVKTPTLPSPWNTRVLIANDTGVQGKHVDVYCGEGSAAQQETLRITGVDGFNKQVCVKSPNGVSIREKIIVGYWHNFANAAGFIKLRDVSGDFDVINVAFAESAPGSTSTIQFTPDPTHTSVNEIKSDIALLKSRGKKVLISIGGANSVVQLNTTTDKQNFITSVSNIITQYGFDGMDLDLEQNSLSLNSGDTDFRSPTTPKITNLISAIRTIANNFGANFMLSMAPETFFVQRGFDTYGNSAGVYLPVIHALRDKLTYIHVQHYNTGSMTALDNRIYSSGNADFHVAMAEMLLQGFPVAHDQNKFFQPLREDQVAIGLPASSSAVGSGFTPVAEAQRALDYLIRGRAFGGQYILRKPVGYPGFKGLMTWSINWDAANNFQFSTSHRAYLDSLP